MRDSFAVFDNSRQSPFPDWNVVRCISRDPSEIDELHFRQTRIRIDHAEARVVRPFAKARARQRPGRSLAQNTFNLRRGERGAIASISPTTPATNGLAMLVPDIDSH